MDTQKIETAVKMIIEAVGEDANREGLQETPARVARMYQQHIQIEQKTNDELEKALDDENVHFIVTDYPIKKEHILSMGLFMEQLYLSVPLTHPYATRKEIKLVELLI